MGKLTSTARGPDEALSRQGSRNSRLIPMQDVHVDRSALVGNQVSYASPDQKRSGTMLKKLVALLGDSGENPFGQFFKQGGHRGEDRCSACA